MRLKALLFSLVGGIIFGAAWQEILPSLSGVAGLGLFFCSQLCLARPNIFLRILLAWMTGFVAFAIACPWIFDTTKYLLNTDSMAISGPLAICVWAGQALIFVLFCVLLHALEWMQGISEGEKGDRRVQTSPMLSMLVLPPLWGLCEAVFPSLFPFPVGCFLVDSLWLAQPAELGGMPLLSLLTASYALAFPALFQQLGFWNQQETVHSTKISRQTAGKQRQRKKGRSSVFALQKMQSIGCKVEIIFVGILMLTVLWGAYRTRQVESEQANEDSQALRMLVVQADTAHRKSNSRMLRASQKVEGKADVVLWPECAIGSYEQSLLSFGKSQQVKVAAKQGSQTTSPVEGANTPLLIGGDSWVRGQDGGVEEEYVSAYLIGRSGTILGRHDKVNLMPYGESIPGESMFPWLRRFFGSDRRLSRGTSISPIGEIRGMKIGTVLCCEDMDPMLSRQLAYSGAEVLVSLANGVAFKSEIALRQHFRIARCRAIESRRYFIRCASRGISAVVAPSGKVAKDLPVLEDCAMMVKIWGRSNQTLFTEYGYLPVTIFGLALLFAGNRSLAFRLYGQKTRLPGKPIAVA